MRVLKEGTRLADRYTLIRRLGGGGMSEVWLARDRRTDSRVALKFLAPQLAQNTPYRTLFHEEWQTGSRLMHPHIVRVFEYHDEPDGPFYSQQFIDGPDLGVVAGQPPLEALRPFGLIADALRYAHGKGLVHRDIKASNVLLDARGLPYLIDFGVAAAPEAPASGGSPIAASPQQLAGIAPSASDDVYALGVLMHESLTGAPPPAMGAGRLAGEAIEAASGLSSVPEELQRLVGDMLAPEAHARPAAEEIAQRLRDAGVAAGPVAISGRVPVAIPEDEIEPEALPSIRPLRADLDPAVSGRTEGRTDQAAGGRGVSPKVALGGLALLMVAFLSVIFWLPDAVNRDVEQTQRRPPVADEEDGVGAEERAAGDESAVSGDDANGADPATEAERKAATDESLGYLLSRLERLRSRGIERWGGQAYLNVMDVYGQGDEAYLEKDYALAGERYREAADMLKPFFDRVEKVFAETMQAAQAAFASGDHSEAVRLFDLAVAITPDNEEAQRGLARARNLSSVLTLTDRGLTLERALELQAAKLAFEKALELDPAWQPAATGLERVKATIRQMSFEQRMSEGLEALTAGNWQSARAAFEAAKLIKPESQEPVDGLLQVDQEVRLANIRRLEQEAAVLEQNEEWQTAIAKYEEIAEIDPDLQFVRDGLARARDRAAIHEKLRTFINDPDSLSAPATMQAATRLLLQVTTMNPTGPRLEDQKGELSRLLKRAATPLKVQLISDNATEVSIFRVGRLGTFSTQELSLRPGAYVATGSRTGYRDVRLEFRVAPEIDLEPIVIKCEEPI